jgi:Putative beta-barrel porin 2
MEAMAIILRRKASLAAILVFSILASMRPVCAQQVPGQAFPALGEPAAPVSGLGAVGGVPGQIFNYGVDAGVGETDNVNLTHSDKVSQTLALADADIDIDQQRRLFSVDAKGTFNYLDYLQGAYSPELIGRFDGLGRISLIPGTLRWVVQDDFGQAQVDPFAAVTPTNRENINYLSTGPDLYLRLGSVGFVDMTGRYARTEYQVSPFDGQLLIGSIAVGRFLSSGSSLSVDGSAERSLFANTVLNNDYTRSSAYGDFEAQGFRTELGVNLGGTKVTQGTESITGPLAKLKLSRKLSAAAKLTFTAGRAITDGSTSFSSLQSGAISTIGTVGGAGATGAVSTAPAPQTTANYTVTYTSLNWQYTRNRTTVSASGQWERDTYDGQPSLDLARETAQFSIERQLNRHFSAQLLGSLYRTDYAHTDYAETDGFLGFGITFREQKGLEIRLRYDHASRIASGLGAGSNYGANIVFLTVGYGSKPRPAS